MGAPSEAERTFAAELTPPPAGDPLPTHPRLFWLAVVAAFVVATTGVERWEALGRRLGVSVWTYASDARGDAGLHGVVVPVRRALFLAAVVALVWFVSRSLHGRVTGAVRAAARDVALWSVGIFAALLALMGRVGLDGMGKGYAFMSRDPFGQQTGWYYRRLLVPALSAEITTFVLAAGATLATWAGLVAAGPLVSPQARILVAERAQRDEVARAIENTTRYVHLAFTDMLTLILIALCLVWLRRRWDGLRWWQALSILTSGFVVFQFELPGYTDALVLILALLAVSLPLDAYGRAALFVLALTTHETAAAIVFLPLIAVTFPRREVRLHVGVLALYGVLWLANFGFHVGDALAVNTQPTGRSAAASLAHDWTLAVCAVLAAYKALWIVVAACEVLLVRRREWRSLVALNLIVGLPLLQLPLAIDGSRLVAFGYLGVLGACVYCARRSPRWAMSALLAVNLALPSVFVGTWESALIPNVVWPRGAYAIWNVVWGLLG
jgi:hypothetical protein